jgi:hypothetical protein
MPKKKVRKAKPIDGFRPIMIDLEVYKAIEAARESFTEMPSAILRRMLGLDHALPAAVPRNAAVEAKHDGAAGDRSQESSPIVIPDGAELRAAYCGVTVTGAVREGIWEVGGSKFDLPSAALIAGDHKSSDTPVDQKGWEDWEIRLPGAESWRPLADVA